MRLLVSVRSAGEAAAALAGGADLIDAKDPVAGALGAVTIDVLRAIVQAVNGARPVTAALGDATTEHAIEREAAAFACAGAALVKVGFAGSSARHRVEALAAAAVRGAGSARVIAVAYADHQRVDGPSPAEVIDVAGHAGLAGVLLDTADKNGPGLRGLMPADALEAWVASARRHGLLVALAGQLAADDLTAVRDAGADVAGVRGAACDGGRTGQVTRERVRLLHARCA
jgi:hypothetical protein